MVYLHVPFCESFCTYCGFFSSVILSEAQVNSENVILSKARNQCFTAYADAVCEEIEDRREEIADTLSTNTLYIGGGTPSVLPLGVFRRIVQALPPRSLSRNDYASSWDSVAC